MYDTPSSRWAAVTARNPSSANAFLYAVITTRIFCRPTCSARLARRANVLFFDTVAEAQAANFRPCKRCKPDQASEEDERHLRRKLAVKACELIEGREGRVTAAKVAKELGVSPRHLYAVFRDVKGVSPGKYAEGVRKQARSDKTGIWLEHEIPMDVDTSTPILPSGIPDLIPDFDGQMSWLDDWEQTLADMRTEDSSSQSIHLWAETIFTSTPSNTAGLNTLPSSTCCTATHPADLSRLDDYNDVFTSLGDCNTLLSLDMNAYIDKNIEGFSEQERLS